MPSDTTTERPAKKKKPIAIYYEHPHWFRPLFAELERRQTPHVKIDAINYKDVRLLGQFVAERGKIIPRRLSGVCTPHQRRVSAAIKQARNIALLPFSARG